MAYSTLVSLENLIDRILSHDLYCISRNGKQHIVFLDKCVICVRAFLEDFPEKAAKNLEARIRDVAMKAEDIIEWFMNQQIRHYFFRYDQWITEPSRIKFESQLRKVTDEMESIAEDVAEMKNSIIIIKDTQQLDNSVDGAGSSSSSQVTDAAAGKMRMVGLNEDLLEIKDRLRGGSRQLQILPITGMGGIGKTTLARNAYNDPWVMEHFQIRVWITISQDYSEERILSELLHSIFPEKRESVAKKTQQKKSNESVAENSQQGNESVAENSQQGNESLAENSQQGNESLAENSQPVAEESNGDKALKVFQALYGRKFLVVIDDVWSSKVLDYVKKLFPNNDNGSRILLTTRLGDVANSSTSTPSHEMRLMDADQSWNLLQEKVLEYHDRIPTELDNTGRQIARSCGGLPLAVVVVAGLLSTVSMNPTSWEEIARNVKSSLATAGDGQVEKILSLSYNHLPHHLRACLLYMGGFPEDREIKVVNLMRLWIAEGFVKPVTSKRFEESAEEYMEDLIKRNLVVVSKSKPNGKIKSCSLHDLVRDLCMKLAQEEEFLVHVMKDDGRRISISRSENTHSLANISSSTIRTIMYFQDTLTGSFGSYRLLRVLDLLSVPFKSSLIPHQFFELFQLRYLAFWYDTDISLPRAMSNLQRLQTLIIKRGKNGSVDFPREIWKLLQLRHVSILDGSFVTAYYPTLALEHLQTLGKVKNLECSLSLPQMFPSLKKLSLAYSWGSGDLLLNNLVHLCGLENLKLELSYRLQAGSCDVPELVLPPSLKKLALIGWGRNEPYLSIHNIGSLPNLQVLKLRKFDFLTREWITGGDDEEGCFPKLRFLQIDDSDLLLWDSSSSCFPVLESLLVHSCWSLTGIPDSIGEIPTLKLIEVKGCERYVADGVRLLQEEQQSYGDDVFQVRCIYCLSSPRAPDSYKRYERERQQYEERERQNEERRKREEYRRPRRRRYKETRASGMHIVTHMLRNGGRI